MRELDVEISVDEDYSIWQLVVACPRRKGITAQEVIDAVGDALLNEGELDPFSERDPSQLDS